MKIIFRQLLCSFLLLSLAVGTVVAQVDDVVLTLANINYNSTDNRVEFDLFINVDNTDADGKIYLAGSDFAISFNPSAYGANVDLVRVTDGAPAPIIPTLGYGFFDVTKEVSNNPFLENVDLNTFFNAMDPFGKSFSGTELLINYQATSPPNCEVDLSTCCPFVNTVYTNSGSLIHNLGRYGITEVVDPALAQIISLNPSSIIPTAIFGYQVTPGTNTGCANPLEKTNGIIANLRINNDVSLPLVLAGFTGWTESNRINNLQWWTSSEVSTSHFDIERSKDGLSFEKIGEVSAAGFSESTIEYFFPDETPFKGVNYYRLKMVDQDQTFTYTSTIALTIKGDSEGVSIFPTPAVDVVNIDYFSELNQSVQIDVIDVSGRTVMSEVVDLIEGFNNNTINVNGLAAGSYMLRTAALGSKQINTFKLVKITP